MEDVALAGFSQPQEALAAEQAAQRGFTVATGRAYPVETGVPYAVLSDALLPILRSLEPAVLSLLTMVQRLREVKRQAAVPSEAA